MTNYHKDLMAKVLQNLQNMPKAELKAKIEEARKSPLAQMFRELNEFSEWMGQQDVDDLNTDSKDQATPGKQI